MKETYGPASRPVEMQRPVPHAPRSDAAQRIVGRRIARIDRILYEFMGVIEADEGALEVHFTDGSVALFDGGSSGEPLGVEAHAWVDAFAGELSPHNAAFVAQCGKWSRVPVSADAPYRELIGATVNAVTILRDRFGCESALAIETDARTLWFVAAGDESTVVWAHPLPYRNRRRYAAAIGA